MIPKDKGGECQTLVVGKKNPCLSPLLFVTLFVSSNLVNLFNAQLVVEELWLRAFIAVVVVVVGGCQPYPIAHSTHVCHSSPSRTLPWSALSPRFLVCWLLTHRLWAILVSRRHFLGLHELLKHPRTVIHVLADVLFLHGKNRSCFLLTQSLYGCASSRRGIPSHFPSSRMVFYWIYPCSISLGEL